MKRLALCAMGILVLACDHPAAQGQIFAPTETGRILAYENPSLPRDERHRERLQVRIAQTERAAGKLLVKKTFTTLQGQMDVLFAYEDGGVTLMKDPHSPVLVVLPKGFPGVRSWEDRGQRFHVEGRAGMPDTGLLLDDTINPVGVWVASEPTEGSGPKRRTFYLENLGEVETQELRDGAWVSINRLVEFGFQDAPAAPKPRS